MMEPYCYICICIYNIMPILLKQIKMYFLTVEMMVF